MYPVDYQWIRRSFWTGQVTCWGSIPYNGYSFLRFFWYFQVFVVYLYVIKFLNN